MLKVTLILLFVVVAAMATPFLQLSDDSPMGDVDVEITVRGGEKTLTYKTPKGNVIDVTHVLKSEGVIVNIPGDQEVCNVRQTTDEMGESLACSERVVMTDEELSPRLAEICREKAVFAEKDAPCEGKLLHSKTSHPRNRRAPGCTPYCRRCGNGVCCGVTCTF